jgi:hypothetical protein
MLGGCDPFLAQIDFVHFRNQGHERFRDFECLTLHDAISLAACLKKERLQRAVCIMHLCSLDFFAHLASEAAPSRPWVSGTVESCRLCILPPQHLEVARRLYCNFDSIVQFDVEFQILFQRDWRLIFKADEPMLSGLKRFRVLAEIRKLPLVTAETKLPRLTAMCVVSAAGMACKLFLVLSQLEGLKS